MNIKDFSKSLFGKVSPQERFFRVMVHYLITKGRSDLLYDEDKYKEYILTIEGEDSDMYKFMIQRRQEYMCNVEDILLKRISR